MEKQNNKKSEIKKVHPSDHYDGICGLCYSTDWKKLEENKSDLKFFTETIFECTQCGNKRSRYYCYEHDKDQNEY